MESLSRGEERIGARVQRKNKTEARTGENEMTGLPQILDFMQKMIDLLKDDSLIVEDYFTQFRREMSTTGHEEGYTINTPSGRESVELKIVFNKKERIIQP